VCDLLDEYAPASWTTPFRRACADWQASLPIFNRSAFIALHDMD